MKCLGYHYQYRLGMLKIQKATKECQITDDLDVEIDDNFSTVGDVIGVVEDDDSGTLGFSRSELAHSQTEMPA